MNLNILCRTPEPCLCMICFRRAVCIGYHQKYRKPMWLCGDFTCTRLAEKVYNMISTPSGTLTRDAYEIGAGREGLSAVFDMLAERYPDIIPALQEISEQDITDAAMAFLTKYCGNMVDRLSSHQAPF